MQSGRVLSASFPEHQAPAFRPTFGERLWGADRNQAGLGFAPNRDHRSCGGLEKIGSALNINHDSGVGGLVRKRAGAGVDKAGAVRFCRSVALVDMPEHMQLKV